MRLEKEILFNYNQALKVYQRIKKYLEEQERREFKIISLVPFILGVKNKKETKSRQE